MPGDLHGRSINNKVTDKLIRDLAQVLQNFNGSVDQVGFVVLDTPFLAERLDKRVGLGQVVTRHGGEQVVVHLVLKSTTEPVDKPLRETVSSRHITSSGHLQLPKVRSGVGIVGGHSVVAQSKDGSQEQTA